MQTRYGSHTGRAGFTLAEMMIVLVILALLVAVGVPKMTVLRRSTNMHAAKEQVAATIVSARAAALRRASTARVNATGNAVWVSVDSSGVDVPLTGKLALDSQFGVQLLASDAALPFDLRGFAQPAGALAVFVVTRDGVRDSVCVTPAGAVLRRGCAL